MNVRTLADWSLPAASFGAPVLGSDQSACPASRNYILISRSSCPINGVHFSILAGAGKKVEESGGKGRKGAVIVGVIFVIYDIYFTATITGFFLNWSELFQSVHVNGKAASAPAAVKTAVDFFDSINFMAKESVQKSFYALNGTLVMYVSLLISAITDGVVRHLNVDDMKKNIFKILAAALVFSVLVVAVARHLSE